MWSKESPRRTALAPNAPGLATDVLARFKHGRIVGRVCLTELYIHGQIPLYAKISTPVRCQSCILNRMLNIAMPEVLLNGAGINPFIGQIKTAGMPEHVGMHWKREACDFSRPQHNMAGRFHIPVDRVIAAFGGGRMVIIRLNRYDSPPSPTHQRRYDEVDQTPRVRSANPYRNGETHFYFFTIRV